MRTKPKVSSNGKLSNDAADYPAQWIAWDASRKNIVAVADDYLGIMEQLDQLRVDDAWVDVGPGIPPGFKQPPLELMPGESKNILDDIKSTLPDAEEWLDSPNNRLGGKKPRDLIGTPDERYIREMLRRVWSGALS